MSDPVGGVPGAAAGAGPDGPVNPWEDIPGEAQGAAGASESEAPQASGPDASPRLPAPRLSGRLEALAETAKAYARSAQADNTQRAYAADWREFASWLRRQGLPETPPDPEAVGLYLASQVERRGAELSVATLERRLSGIAWRYRQLGQPLEIRDRHIATVLAGIRRRHGRPPYPQNPDTQQWVEGVWKEMKQLDPSRLVEDNSADKRDHVATDINSWHFYIDDYARAKALIDNVVAKTFPGSEFNFVKGYKQQTAPLINSEYGAVGAGAGDRDVSWGFHFLTNELRLHEKIQGYIYTELTDIEWEHNGFYNYDRSAKDFGYDAFVPGMTTRDLQGEDFVGYDGPPVVKATTFTLPVFVSHFSARTDQPTLRWWRVRTKPSFMRCTPCRSRTFRSSPYLKTRTR